MKMYIKWIILIASLGYIFMIREFLFNLPYNFKLIRQQVQLNYEPLGFSKSFVISGNVCTVSTKAVITSISRDSVSLKLYDNGLNDLLNKNGDSFGKNKNSKVTIKSEECISLSNSCTKEVLQTCFKTTFLNGIYYIEYKVNN